MFHTWSGDAIYMCAGHVLIGDMLFLPFARSHLLPLVRAVHYGESLTLGSTPTSRELPR